MSKKVIILLGGVFVGLIAFLSNLSTIAGYLKIDPSSVSIRIPIEYILNCALTAWNWLWTCHACPGWLLLLLMILAGILLIGISILAYASFTEKNKIQPPWFHDFNNFRFRGAEWHWDWMSDNKIEKLNGFCPDCDGHLVCALPSRDVLYGFREHEVEFFCEHCNNKTVSIIPGHTLSEAEGYVKREIYRQIRNKEKERQTN